jgi:hypothetical protein
MKKQTKILATTWARPKPGRLQLLFQVVIAAIFYRNYSNRRLPSGIPPNTLGLAKKTLQSVLSESDAVVSKLANFFYRVTGESLYSILQFLAIAGLLVVLVAGIVYIIKTH